MKTTLIGAALLLLAISGVALSADKSVRIISRIEFPVGQTVVTKRLATFEKNRDVLAHAVRNISAMGIVTTVYTFTREDGTTSVVTLDGDRAQADFGRIIDVKLVRRPIDAKYLGIGEIILELL
jgi:hypothetical protein